MKKVFRLFAVIMLVAMLSVDCFAITRGAYVEDNGYYDDKVTNPAPGDTVYITLMKKSDEDQDFEVSSSQKPTKAEITKIKVVGISDDDEYDIIKKGKLDIVYEEVEEGVEWYFAKLEIDDIDLEDYPDDGFTVEGTLRVTRKSGKTFTIDLEDIFDTISYKEAKDKEKLEKSAQLYKFKSNKEIKLEFPNEKGWFEGKTRSAINVFAGMSHSKVKAIVDKNDDAKLVFYIGNGAEFEKIKNGKIFINADDDEFLYEIIDGKLKNRTSWYDDDEEAFVIETDTLGSYVVSDEKLSTSYDYDDEDDDEDEDEEDDDLVFENDDEEDDEDEGYDWDNYDHVLINPNTGVEI